MAWSTFQSKYFCREATLLNVPLWDNPQIPTELLFYPRWDQVGIHTPLDLIKPHGSIMALEEIMDLYGLKTNFLEYLRIQRCLKIFIKELNTQNFNLVRPIIPPYLMVLLIGSGSKYFYDILNVQYDNMALKNKWSKDLNQELINFD